MNKCEIRSGAKCKLGGGRTDGLRHHGRRATDGAKMASNNKVKVAVRVRLIVLLMWLAWSALLVGGYL